MSVFSSKGIVRFMYVAVFSPKVPVASPGQAAGEPKYGAQILIPKSDKETVAQLYAAIDAAREEGKTSKKGWKGRALPNELLKINIYDGEVKYPDDPNYKGMLVLSANNKNRPGLVHDVLGDRLPIIDPVDFYSGCWGHVQLSVFPYDTGSNGIGFGLNNILKVDVSSRGLDQSKIGGQQNAESAFKDFAVGGGDDLMG